ncbi:hypothetical protein GCM10022221_67540 [Actinocorallia aurea]
MQFLPSLRRKARPMPAEPSPDLETKDLYGAYYAALAAVGGGLYTGGRAKEWPLERAVTEGYERVVWTFKAINTIGQHQAGLPFRAMDGADEVKDHPWAHLLNVQSNPLESALIFRKRLSAQFLLSKRGVFIEVTRSRAGTPVRIDLLPPGRTEIIPGTGAELIKCFRVTRADGSYAYLDPERVKWLRDPHPIDPFAGTTPLEAAGLSIELDYFADLYNATFMKNDGRPGGVLSLDKDADPASIERVVERFGPGPYEAGKTTVVTGSLSYVDTATTPRDMAYGEMATSTKEKILAAFGVAESVLGNAANRTWDNAELELHNFWTLTMRPHNGGILDGLVEDDGLDWEFDTSGITVLERPKLLRRQEAREEVAAGLRTIDEYREEAGLPVLDLPHTRALYLPAGRTPIPTREEDAEALGMGAPVEEEEPAVEGGGDAALEEGGDGEGGGLPVVDVEADADVEEVEVPDGETKMLRVRIIREDVEADPPEVKALAAAGGGEGGLEVAVAGALAGSMERMVQRSLARLRSPKGRKHTRHWTPREGVPVDTSVGDQALDASAIVDPVRWEAEAAAAVMPVLKAASLSPAAVAAALGYVERSAAASAREVTAVITRGDRGGADVDTISSEIRDAAAALLDSLPEAAFAVLGAARRGADR